MSPFIAAELRAVIARQGTSAREVAQRLGRPQAWISRRIGRTADVDLTFEEVAQMAQALGVDVEGLVVAALCACRDSNPKPSDLVSRVVAPFEVGRCGVCGAWTMDGYCRTPHGRFCQTGCDTEWVLAA